MKNSLEITRKYQIGYMILAHIKAVLVCGVFEAVAFYKFLFMENVSVIFAAVFTIIYGMILYGYSRKLSLLDNKSYTPLSPSVKYGFLWGVIIGISALVFVALFMISFGHGTLGVCGVMLSYVWLAPYFGFINIGKIPEYAMVIMVIIPIIATTLGYIAGNKKFDIVEKLDSLTFEKDEDEE